MSNLPFVSIVAKLDMEKRHPHRLERKSALHTVRRAQHAIANITSALYASKHGTSNNNNNYNHNNNYNNNIINNNNKVLLVPYSKLQITQLKHIRYALYPKLNLVVLCLTTTYTATLRIVGSGLLPNHSPSSSSQLASAWKITSGLELLLLLVQ